MRCLTKLEWIGKVYNCVKEVENVLSEKYLIIKKENEYTSSKALDKSTFEKLQRAAIDLETFNTLTFLSNSYVKAKEDFLAYDFAQFNVREVDMFNMFLNVLEAMATNRNLWIAYMKRNYSDDSEMLTLVNGKKRTCFEIKDSEYYDSCIEYVVSKVLRIMIAHYSKPYSEIVYFDDYSRKFIVTKEDLLQLGKISPSAKQYIDKSKNDYYDIVKVIKRALEITDEINVYMFNLIAKKEWHRFIAARYTIREYIGIDWQGAYLVWENTKYPKDHLLYISQIDVSKNAMNAIRSIAAGSMRETRDRVIPD